MEEAIASQVQEDKGAPAWVVTFADLMTLLMCFFVLLLSFSEMDALKFKQLAGSMSEAYGVQREIKVMSTPIGVSMIAREFSPGRPVRTIKNEVRQYTTQDMRRNLAVPDKADTNASVPPRPPQPKMVMDKETPDTHGQHEGAKKLGLRGLGDGDKNLDKQSMDRSQGATGQADAALKGLDEEQVAKALAAKLKGMPGQTHAATGKDAQMAKSSQGEEQHSGMMTKGDAAGAEGKAIDAALTKEFKAIEKALSKEIQQGLIQVVAKGSKIIIRIREKGSFPSGNADLIEPFYPILMKMSDVLEASKGDFIVAGHTDSVPIRTARFRSNWDLSAARAVTVAHELMAVSTIKPSRFRIEGYADTRPLESNRTASGRAINRRVEVIIVQGKDVEGRSISVMRKRQQSDGARPVKPVNPAPSAKAYPLESGLPQLKGRAIPSSISPITRK